MEGKLKIYEKAGGGSGLKAGEEFDLFRLLEVLKKYRPKGFMRAVLPKEKWTYNRLERK